MGIGEHLEALSTEGALLAAAASEVGMRAPVPTCPEWTIKDLLWHTGIVHRWAKTIVSESRPTCPLDSEMDAIAGPIPDSALLVEWYRESHAQLLRALDTAPADLDCWRFLKSAPPPVEFWARRQAHEATIHRVDAESARGDEISPIDNAFAADGIDELLIGFHGRRSSLIRSLTPKVLRLHATDDPAGGSDWFLHITPDPLRTSRISDQSADCTLSGPVELIYLALWNRCRIDDLTVTGDPGVIELWQDLSPVLWSNATPCVESSDS